MCSLRFPLTEINDDTKTERHENVCEAWHQSTLANSYLLPKPTLRLPMETGTRHLIFGLPEWTMGVAENFQYCNPPIPKGCVSRIHHRFYLRKESRSWVSSSSHPLPCCENFTNSLRSTYQFYYRNHIYSKLALESWISISLWLYLTAGKNIVSQREFWHDIPWEQRDVKMTKGREFYEHWHYVEILSFVILITEWWVVYSVYSVM